MKNFQKQIVHFFLLIGVIFSVLAIYDRGLSTLDIQMYDTYIVIAKIHLFGLYACLAFLYGLTYKAIESNRYQVPLMLKCTQLILLIGSILFLSFANPNGHWYNTFSAGGSNEFVATAYSLNESTGPLLLLSMAFLVGSFLLYLLQLTLYFLRPQTHSDLLDH
ncbi:MAG: hypothetical protein AAF990_04880 [Bacteroidota bacterium]